MRATTYYAPNTPASYATARPSVFLAGSIEMGVATDWQKTISESTQDYGLGDLPITIYNPRRPDWDSTWTQDLTCAPFVEQVNWELTHLAWADLIALYLDPSTKSPISLMELGLHAHTGKVIVCCPKGFWRKGNVDIACRRWGVPVYEEWTPFVAALRERIITRLLP